MEEKRKYRRFPVGLNARCIGGGNNEGRECKIIDISRDGMAIHLYLKEKVNIAPSLVLEIDFPKKAQPINLLVSLKWIKGLEDETGFDFVAGGQLRMIEPEDKMILLEYAYGTWIGDS